ncbi:MAG: TadE/TadG family type IV pilus assembly protein [Actinomycetales bacterium]
MTRSKPRGGRRDSGAVAVEFALILPILLLIVFGIIDFGRMLNAQITLTQAAREGARWAALGQSGVAARVTAAAPGMTPGPTTTVLSSCPANAAVGAYAEVRASYTFNFVTPFGAISTMIGGPSYGTMNLQSTARFRCGG